MHFIVMDEVLTILCRHSLSLMVQLPSVVIVSRSLFITDDIVDAHIIYMVCAAENDTAAGKTVTGVIDTLVTHATNAYTSLFLQSALYNKIVQAHHCQMLRPSKIPVLNYGQCCLKGRLDVL